MKRLILNLFLIVLIKQSFAQDCNAILIPDRSTIRFQRDYASMAIRIIDQENIDTYDEYKNSKYNATVPIDGILVGLA